jgi:hypothetical protein
VISEPAPNSSLAGKTVRDGANVRLDVEHRAAAERLVDSSSQASVVRLISS